MEQFPSYVEFRTGGDDVAVALPEQSRAKTPEERMDEAYAEIRSGLAKDLLDRIPAASPVTFEPLVVDLLLKMGYGGTRSDAGQRLSGTGDGSVDGVINQDVLGLDRVSVQAERWTGAVGRPVVQAFVGSLEGHRATKGVIISTSAFTEDAKRFAEAIGKRVILIDGASLTRYMIDFGLAVRSTRVYDVPAVDLDYFEGAE